jgi:hypothetical protein
VRTNRNRQPESKEAEEVSGTTNKLDEDEKCEQTKRSVFGDTSCSQTKHKGG